MSYGFLGDVLERSENLRWMGKQRYNFAGFLKFLSLKLELAVVSYLLCGLCYVICGKVVCL